MQQPEKQAPDRKQPWVGQPRGNEDDEINLVELLYRLIEKWKIVALASLLGALIAAVYTFCFITPMYTATSKLYVVNTKDSAINLSDLQIGNYLASDYACLLTKVTKCYPFCRVSLSFIFFSARSYCARSNTPNLPFSFFLIPYMA